VIVIPRFLALAVLGDSVITLSFPDLSQMVVETVAETRTASLEPGGVLVFRDVPGLLKRHLGLGA
jgi:hypothetical protein